MPCTPAPQASDSGGEDYEVKIPTVGESISEVQIGQWLKSEGDDIVVLRFEAGVVIVAEMTDQRIAALGNLGNTELGPGFSEG